MKESLKPELHFLEPPQCMTFKKSKESFHAILRYKKLGEHSLKLPIDLI